VIRLRKVTTPCSAAKACGKEIAFLRTAKGRPMPVDGDSLTTADREALARKEEVAYRHGEHVTHFGTCPARKQFKKRSAEQAAADADRAADMGAEDATLWGDEPFGDR
jgi:hypothetical protein